MPAVSVVDSVNRCMLEVFGNPGSEHSLGRDAKKAIELARKHVADFIGTTPEHIVFTAGGTEANNLALRGVKHRDGYDNMIVTSNVEHDSIINTVNSLSDCRDVCFINANKYGFVDKKDVEQVLQNSRPDLVSIIHMNNETGVLNNISEISDVCKQHGVLLHTDCVQSAGCVKLDVDEIGCDFMSISAHKIHGLKGVGALYVRDFSTISPIITGGMHQEFGLRSGTENVVGIVAFGEACRIINKFGDDYFKDVVVKRNTLIGEIYRTFYEEYPEFDERIHINGKPDMHLGKTVNIRFDGVDAETLLVMLSSNGVMVSSGSACRSLEEEPSRVLTNIGLTTEQARASIRLSVSHYTTTEECSEAARILVDCVRKLS